MHFISVMLNIIGIKHVLMEFQTSVILIKKCGFCPKQNKNNNFRQKCSLSIKKHKKLVKTACHSDHSLKQFALEYVTLC